MATTVIELKCPGCRAPVSMDQKWGKSFLAGRAAVDQSEEYIYSALMIEPKGVYYTRGTGS